MTSVENNIMEKGVGQWWSVNGAIIDVRRRVDHAGERALRAVQKGRRRREEHRLEKGRSAPHCHRRRTASRRRSMSRRSSANWNTVEVVFWGGHCIHILNGQVNLVLVNPRYQEGGQWHPLTHGQNPASIRSGGSFLSQGRRCVRCMNCPPELPGQSGVAGGGRRGFHAAARRMRR